MKSYWTLIFLTLAFIFPVSPIEAADNSDQWHYNTGLTSMKEGNPREALKYFTKAIEINPNESKYYNDRGVAYKRSGDLEKALSDYEKSLEINPHYTNALNNKGVVFLEQGRYDEALASFEEALKYGGLEGKIFTNVGIAKAAKGDHKAAVKDFNSAVSMQPVDPRSFLFMGQSLEHLGDRDKALKMYQVALGIIKEAQIIAIVEKKIAALDKNAVGSILPASNDQATYRNPQKSSGSIQPPPGKSSREIVLASKPPNLIEQIVKKSGPKQDLSTLPEALQEFNNQTRAKIIGQMGPASAEILRQANDFVEKSEDHKAMVRFEDIRQLEKRNKNYRAVGWALLEIGRIHIRRGDYVKAEESIDSAQKIFSSLKLENEKILAVIELARLKRVEKSEEKSAVLFTHAQRLAESLNSPAVSKGVEDLASGSFEKSKKKEAQAKTEPQETSPREPVSLTKVEFPQQKQEAKAEAPKIVGQSISTSDLKGVKSVFDLKTQSKSPNVNSSLNSDSVTISSSKDTSTAISKENLKVLKQGDQDKAGVESPSAARHPDSGKPLTIARSKDPKIGQSLSKDDLKRSIERDLNEIRKLRRQNDEKEMIPILERLSRNYLEYGAYEKALKAINVDLIFRVKLAMKDGRSGALQLRGSIYERLGKNVEALEDYTWAQSLSKNKPGNLGVKSEYLSTKLGLNANAVISSYKALWEAREKEDSQTEIKSLLDLGNMYSKAEHLEEASKYYEFSNASLMAERSEFYEKLGKTEQAKKIREEALQALKSLDYLIYFSYINRSKSQNKLSAIQ